MKHMRRLSKEVCETPVLAGTSAEGDPCVQIKRFFFGTDADLGKCNIARSER